MASWPAHPHVITFAIMCGFGMISCNIHEVLARQLESSTI